MNKNYIKSALASFLLVSSFFVNAQQDSTVTTPKDTTEKIQRFNISLGGFFPLVTTAVRFNSESGAIGTDIHLEEALGLTSHPKVFRLDGIYQMTKRSSFKATYFQMNRKQTWVLDKDITIRDTTFNIGLTLDYKFNMQYFGLNYMYSPIVNKNFRAGLSVGLRYLYFDAEFKAEGNKINKSAGGGVGVPVMLFGLNASGNILPKLIGRYDFQIFQLSVQGISALVYENRLALEYYFTKNIGIGGSYNTVLYNVQQVPLSTNFKGEVKYSINGLSLFAAFKF